MKATLVSKEKGEAIFTIEFSAEEFNDATVKAYQNCKDKYPVDGFRKGKAPRSIIEKKYGSNVFTEDAINAMFNSEYPKALDELEIDVIEAPRVAFSEIKQGEALTATITVATYPEFEVEGYMGVEIEKIDDAITEEDLDKEMEMLQKRNSRLLTVEREAKDGDTVILDYKGFVGDEQFEGGTAEAYTLKLGSGSFIPGFEEQLVGTKAEEEKDVKVTFPEQYHAADLAGKEAIFKCKIHEIKEEQIPELDDEFAKDTSEFDTLKELKESKKKELQERKTSTVQNQMKDKVLEKVYEANEIDIPDVMVDDEVEQMVKETDQQLQMQGINLEQYMAMVGKDIAAFKEDIREEALKRVKTRMIISAIVEKEKIEASEDDIKAQLDLLAMQYQVEADKIREMMGTSGMNFIETDCRMRNAVDYIFENAVIK